MENNINISVSTGTTKLTTSEFKAFKLIGNGFFLSIPLLFFLFLFSDDHGLFLPRTALVDLIIPTSFIHVKYEYELRCFEELLFILTIIYFIVLGILNLSFWRNNSKIKFRIFHAALTIGLAFIFFTTMVEYDTDHYSKISSSLGRQQYENKVSLFYLLLFAWATVQLIYFLTFIKGKIFNSNKN